MSVKTAADERVEAARENIASAMESLGNVVFQRPWGWDEFSQEYRPRLIAALELLVKVDNTLNPLWINP